MNLNLDKYFNYALHPNLRLFYIILGFVSSFPIYLNPIKLKFFIRKLIIDGHFVEYPFITVSMVDGIYLPIGFFTVGFLYTMIILNYKKEQLLYLSIVLPLTLILLNDISLPRTFGLFFSMIFIYVSLIAVFEFKKKNKKNTKNIKYFLFSYIFGFIFMCASNIASTAYVHYVGLGLPPYATNLPSLVHHQIFSYEFYQYYVSFASLNSLLFSMSVVIFLLNINKKISSISIIILILATIISYFTIRKISSLDLLILLTILTVYPFITKKKLRESFRFIFIYIYVLFHSIFYFMYMVRSRFQEDDLFTFFFADRIYPYIIFMTELSYTGFNGLLFGYSKGFGGYSNFFIDMFVRVGFSGIAFLLLLLLIFAHLMMNFLKKTIKLKSESNYLYFVFYIFLIFFFIAGNMLNLNIMVPYYFVNFSVIILFFNYLIKMKNNNI